MTLPGQATAKPEPISREEWRRLSPLIDELLELTPAQRRQRLAEMESADAASSAQLRRLLDEDLLADADGFLAGQAGTPSEPAVATLTGMCIGAYTLESPLGQGGSGSVWRARRTNGRVDAVAAVKLLHLSLVGHSAAERFRREGAILARLTHPHIARLLDAGVTTGGQPYLVLELVQGRPIDEQCDALALDVDSRLRLFLDVLGAVAHAHRHLVVHRDIKPQNVLLTPEGQVKLLDFGIAKLIDAEGLDMEATALTRDAGRVLTPAYAAPEQFSGAAISTATDVYALGVLLYRLLAGQHPTLREGAGSSEVIRTLMNEEPTRPSRAVTRAVTRNGDRGSTQADSDAWAQRCGTTPQRLSRRLTGDLDNILARMLRKNPAERYASVDAVADDLRRHLAHLPVSARADTWRYRLTKFVRRQRVLVAATALVLVTLLGGIVGTVSQAQRASRFGELAQQERDRALNELEKAEAANEFIGNVLTEGSRRPLSSAGLLDQASGLLEKQFADAPPLKARMQLMLGTLYGELLSDGKALAMLDRAADLATQHPGALSSADRSQVDCLRAALRQDLPALNEVLTKMATPAGQPDWASEAAPSSPSDLQQARAVCLTRRSVLHKRMGRLQEAEADARTALQLLGKPRPGRDLALIQAHRELASAIGNQGKNAQAVAEWRALLTALEARGRARSIYAANAYNNLATRLASAGQELASLDAQQQAVDIWRELQGEAQIHPLLWANLATSLDTVGRHAEAEAAYQRAVASVGPDTPADIQRSTVRLGAIIACRAGRLSECERLARSFERLQPADQAPDAYDRAVRLTVGAELARAEGDSAAERSALREAVRIARASSVKSTLLPAAATRLANVDMMLGDLPSAFANVRLAETAANDLSRGFAHSTRVGLVLTVRGKLELASGKVSEARNTLQQALAHLTETSGPGSPGAVEARQALEAGALEPASAGRSW